MQVHKCEDGTILVPVQNYQGTAVHMEAGALLGEARSLSADPGVLTLCTYLPHQVTRMSQLAAAMLISTLLIELIRL